MCELNGKRIQDMNRYNVGKRQKDSKCKNYPIRNKDTIDICKYEKGIQIPFLMS